MADQYNKILTTVNSVTSNYSFTPDLSNVIVIDTSNNRIGINTLNPLYSIDISSGLSDTSGTIRVGKLIADTAFVNASINNNLEVSNNLVVQGDASINNVLEVSKSIYINNDSITDNGMYLNTNKILYYDNNLLKLDSTNIRILGNVIFDNAPTFTSGNVTTTTSADTGGGFIYNTSIGITPGGGLNPSGGYFTFLEATNITQSTDSDTGALVVYGGAGIGRNLNVGGDASINNILEVSNNFLVKGSSQLGKLYYQGNTIVHKDNITDIDASYIIKALPNGRVHINCHSTKRISFNHEDEELMFVSSNGNIDISKNLTVHNRATIDNRLEVSNNLLVLGDASINNILEVSNNLLVLGDALVNNNVEISNNLIVKGDISCINIIYGDLTGSVDGDLVGNVTGNLLGNVTGNHYGNVIGNIVGNLVGNITGNVTGNLVGDVTGNVTGNLLGSIDLGRSFTLSSIGPNQTNNQGGNYWATRRHSIIKYGNTIVFGVNETGVVFSPSQILGSQIVTFSDDRLKHNEININNGLTIIRQLEPQKYQKTNELLDANFNGDLSGYEWTYESGLIAQDLLEINDLSFVINGGDYYDESNNLIENPYYVNYNSLFTYNIAATKELDAIVQNQENEINELKNKNTILENEIHTMKTALNLLLTQANLTNI